MQSIHRAGFTATASLFIVLAISARDIQAQGFIEAPLASANPIANTINSLGMTIDVSGVVMRTPGGIALTADDLVGAPLPGMLAAGYVGGTVFADLVQGPTGVVATTVTVTMPETVLIGNVTQNDPGTGLEGRTFSVMGVEVRAANDPRLDPFSAIINSLPVDISTIPVGTIAAVEGYFGDDGLFYAQVLEAEVGIVLGGPQVAIERARCRNGEIEVRGPVVAASYYENAAASVAWAALAIFLLRRWADASNWGEMHEWALSFGVLLVSMTAGFLGSSLWLKMDVIFKVALNLLAIAGMIGLAYRIRRRATE
mgnify:CR=1 FL=1